MEEGIVTDPREADVGSILAFGFAPYTGGTLSYIDGIGAANSSRSPRPCRRNTARTSRRQNCSSTWPRRAKPSTSASIPTPRRT